jgi:GNAT superfamily N-acetyltransferase
MTVAVDVHAVGTPVVGFHVVAGDEVEQLYVSADWRGTGVAAALLTHAEDAIAVEHVTAWLAVAPGNARARRFYERCGWRDTGAFDNPADTADGVVLVPTRRYEKRVRGQQERTA